MFTEVRRVVKGDRWTWQYTLNTFESMTMGGVECITPAGILLKESVHVHYYDNAIPKAQAIPISNFRSLSLIAFILCAFKKSQQTCQTLKAQSPGEFYSSGVNPRIAYVLFRYYTFKIWTYHHYYLVDNFLFDYFANLSRFQEVNVV